MQEENSTSTVSIENQKIETENLVFGNIYKTNNEACDPSFIEVGTDDDDDFPSPLITQKYVSETVKNRIIIIQGNPTIDVIGLSRKIAKQILDDNLSGNTFELIENEENKSISAQLKKRGENVTVLMHSIHPKHIQYDFKKIISQCEAKKSYYIITTESSKETWLQAGHIVSNFWQEVPTEIAYDPNVLKNWFIRKLKHSDLAFLPINETISSTTKLSPKQSINDVILTIPSPQKLIILSNHCRRKTEVFSEEELQKIIQNLTQTQEEIILKWFNNLSHNQKVISIGTALYSGLFTTQYFEAFTQLSQTSFWHVSSDSVGALDYHNLEFLDPFFHFESTIEGDIILVRNQSIRSQLLKVAYGQYRRHLDKALMLFTKIVRDSYRRDIDNWELFGTQQRRALLRQIFIETTRDIGINGIGNIESIYLQLAAHNHHYIQGIVAKSLAQYRQLDQDDLLFETLKKWLNNRNIKERMELFLREKPENKWETISAIKTTTVRTLAYAADYDRPNQLNENIINYLLEFSTDKDEHVERAIISVLPKFIHHHTYQLRDHIFNELMIHSAYSISISKGLELAYRNYPDAIKGTFQYWISSCIDEPSKHNRRQQNTFRDNQLVTIIGTLQKIPIYSDRGFSISELYEISLKLIRNEKRNNVVRELLTLLSILNASDYKLAYLHIETVLDLISKNQRKEFVQLWISHYLQQRASLINGDFILEINDQQYPAWEDPDERPLTEIEKTLFHWLNTGTVKAKRFATLTFLEIAQSFEIKEHELIKEHLLRKEKQLIQIQQERRASALKYAAGQVQQKASIGLDFWLRVRIYFYLLFEQKQNRERLKDIILTFQHEKYSKHSLRLVIHKWSTRKQGELTTKLAKWLGKLIHKIKN